MAGSAVVLVRLWVLRTPGVRTTTLTTPEHIRRDRSDTGWLEPGLLLSGLRGGGPGPRHRPGRRGCRAGRTRRPAAAAAPMRCSSNSARAGPSSRSPASDTPPPMTKESGSSTAASSARPRPSRRRSRERAECDRVTLARRRGDVPAGVPSGVPSPSESRAAPAVLGRPRPRVAQQRVAAGELLEAAAPPAAARRTVGVQHRWPTSPQPEPAAVEPPVEHERAADPGAHGDHHESSRPRAAPNRYSAQAAALASFSTTTGSPVAASSCARTVVAPAPGSARTHDRPRLVDQPGRPDADGLDAWSRPRARHDLGDRPRPQRGRPPACAAYLRQDVALLVDDAGGHLGAADVDPDGQGHARPPAHPMSIRSTPDDRRAAHSALVRGHRRAQRLEQRPGGRAGAPRPRAGARGRRSAGNRHSLHSARRSRPWASPTPGGSAGPLLARPRTAAPPPPRARPASPAHGAHPQRQVARSAPGAALAKRGADERAAAQRAGQRDHPTVRADGDDELVARNPPGPCRSRWRTAAPGSARTPSPDRSTAEGDGPSRVAPKAPSRRTSSAAGRRAALGPGSAA